MHLDVMEEKIKKHDDDLCCIKKEIEDVQNDNRNISIKQAEMNILVGTICANVQNLTNAVKAFTISVITGMGGLIIWGIQIFLNK